jgi:hypothetical protein
LKTLSLAAAYANKLRWAKEAQRNAKRKPFPFLKTPTNLFLLCGLSDPKGSGRETKGVRM